jgi:hypothetical protein
MGKAARQSQSYSGKKRLIWIFEGHARSPLKVMICYYIFY